MTCAELIKEAAKIIYQVHDEVKTRCLSWSSLGWESSLMECTRGCRRMCYRTQRSSPSLPLKRTATLTRICLKFQQNSCPRDIPSDEGMSPISFKSLTCPNCPKYEMVQLEK